MERLPDIGFKSYDRFFPSQDRIPVGGFGNLIRPAASGAARASGNSLFIDETFSPYPDQWAFLSAIRPMARSRVDHLIGAASASGKSWQCASHLVDEDEEPWLAPPSRRRPAPTIAGPLPSSITVVRADQIYITRGELPGGIDRLPHSSRRISQNPEYYAAQAVRRPTPRQPRIISCAELTSHHIALPRGCFDAVGSLLTSLGIAVSTEDRRVAGAQISLSFVGELRMEQESAVAALLPHDTGILARNDSIR